MLAIIAQISLVSTMFWLYAAAALLVVLFVLLTAPYFGVFGERDVEPESDRSESVESTEGS